MDSSLSQSKCVSFVCASFIVAVTVVDVGVLFNSRDALTFRGHAWPSIGNPGSAEPSSDVLFQMICVLSRRHLLSSNALDAREVELGFHWVPGCPDAWERLCANLFWSSCQAV